MLQDWHHDSSKCKQYAVMPLFASRLSAQGKLRCLGSNQHLKSKFGKGYVVQLKVARFEFTCVQTHADVVFCV